MDILAAIDGTLSETHMNKSGALMTDSAVHRFYARFNSRGGCKRYFPGPDLAGLEVALGVSRVLTFLEQALGQKPAARIVLVGFSRGGFIAIEAARRLSGRREVYFLGLYDAVDRAPYIGGRTIDNVLYAYHALRAPERGSRRWFGNDGRRAAPGVHYNEQFFFASHGGVGGMMPEGDPSVTRDDRIYGDMADSWLRARARSRGLSV